MNYNPRTPVWKAPICNLVDKGRAFVERLESDPYSTSTPTAPNFADYQTRVAFQKEVQAWRQNILQILTETYEDLSILQGYCPPIEEIGIEYPNGRQEIDYFRGPLKVSISGIVEALNQLVTETNRAVGQDTEGCP